MLTILRPVLLAVGLVLFTCASLARDPDPYEKFRGIDENDEDFSYDSSQDVPWAEESIVKPAAPNLHALTALDIESAPRGFTVLLDTASLTRGKYDDLIRYWLALKSRRGTLNFSYEGMKCNTGEYKLYGYAMPDGKGLRPYAKPRWKPLRNGGRRNYRAELKERYLCQGVTPRPIKEIRALAAGRKKQDIDPYAELLD